MRNTDAHGPAVKGDDGLIPKHGGYRNTKSWQLADLIYDVTVRFCDRFVDRRSRTHDQMVQAARSGCQNLQEGSIDSATSKKIELKLTGTARGSLEELRRDYEKFLAHRELPEWPPEHPALERFKARHCATLKDFRAWVAEEYAWFKVAQRDTDGNGRTPTPECPTPPVENACMSSHDFGATCAANGALSLLNLCIYLVGRQLEAQAKAFEEEGGFTERLHRIRKARRGRA